MTQSSSSNKDVRPVPAPEPAETAVRASSTTLAGKKSTIYDLARIAGVSPGTVSRVLNNRDKVKPETRERVLRAANALNLKPQASVRFRQIAILSEPTFPDRIEGYAATLTAHLSFAFARRNIGVVLPSNPFEQLPVLFLDGLIAVTFDKPLKALLAKLESRMHVAYMDKFDLGPSEYAICSDHFNSGYLAAKHFIAHGKRRLGFLGGNNNAPFIERLKGFRQALTEADISFDERLHVLIGPETSHVSAITRIVRAEADSIYVPGTSFQAMECLHILTYVMGIKVPETISLIGGENEGISALQNPPLTTIEEPLREMAEQAATMLDQLTAGKRVANRQVILPVRLIERDSVA
jgi:LacI family transcriptional regulator